MMGHTRFYELLEEMRSIHDKKNSDYSKKDDPLSNFRLCEDFGMPSWPGILVRMSDKYSRLPQLTIKLLNGEKPAVEDESMKDTLIDLANYCLLCIILLEVWTKGKNPLVKIAS